MKIVTTKKSRPSNIAIGLFGFSGTGKSSIAKTLPRKSDKDVLIIDIENGLEVLRDCEFDSIRFSDVEGSNSIEKMNAVITYLMENPNKYEWIVMDSFTHYADKMKMEFEKDPARYGLITQSGHFDGLAMYGKLRQKYNATIMAFLSLTGNKLALFGAEEFKNGPDTTIQVLIDGSFKKRVMFQFDEFWGLRVSRVGDEVKRELVVNSDGTYIAKSRMDGGSGGKLDTYEPVDVAAIMEKCYGKS